MAKKSLEEIVNATLEEAPVVEEPVLEETAEAVEAPEKKTRSKKAKKEEEVELSPVAKELVSWNIPKTIR